MASVGTLIQKFQVSLVPVTSKGAVVSPHRILAKPTHGYWQVAEPPLGRAETSARHQRKMGWEWATRSWRHRFMAAHTLPSDRARQARTVAWRTDLHR